MAVIVKSSFNDEKVYKNRNVYTKIGNKKNQVYFTVEVDDSNFDEAVSLAKVDKNILMLEYAGSDMFIKSKDLSSQTSLPYIGVPVEVGANFTEDDIVKIASEYPKQITILIKLPSEYNNMEMISKLCKKFSNIRFCGGYTFDMDGCKLGYCGRDILAEHNIKFGDANYIFSDEDSCLPTFDFENVTLDVSSKPERISNTTSTKSAAPKKLKKSFSSLFGDCSGNTL